MTNNTRGDENLLDELHGVLAVSMLNELKRYKPGGDKEGEDIPASLLTAIQKFLKDNGIDRPLHPGSTEDLLADEMPNYDDEENVVPMSNI